MLSVLSAARIRKIPGVREVTPIKIVVNNCGASLDVVTFRGIPSGDIRAVAARSAAPRGRRPARG